MSNYMRSPEYHRARIGVYLSELTIRFGNQAEAFTEVWQVIDEALMEWENQVREHQAELRVYRKPEPVESTCSICGLPRSKCTAKDRWPDAG